MDACRPPDARSTTADDDDDDDDEKDGNADVVFTGDGSVATKYGKLYAIASGVSDHGRPCFRVGAPLNPRKILVSGSVRKKG